MYKRLLNTMLEITLSPIMEPSGRDKKLQSCFEQNRYHIVSHCVPTKLIKRCDALIKKNVSRKDKNSGSDAKYLYETLSGSVEIWQIKSGKKLLRDILLLQNMMGQPDVYPKLVCSTDGIVLDNFIDSQPSHGENNKSIYAIITGNFGLSIVLHTAEERKIEIPPLSAFVYKCDLKLKIDGFVDNNEKDSLKPKWFIPVCYTPYSETPDAFLDENIDRFTKSITTDISGKPILSGSPPDALINENLQNLINCKAEDGFLQLLGCDQSVYESLKEVKAKKGCLRTNLAEVLKSNAQITRINYIIDNNAGSSLMDGTEDLSLDFPSPWPKRQCLREQLEMSDDSESDKSSGKQMYQYISDDDSIQTAKSQIYCSLEAFFTVIDAWKAKTDSLLVIYSNTNNNLKQKINSLQMAENNSKKTIDDLKKQLGVSNKKLNSFQTTLQDLFRDPEQE